MSSGLRDFPISSEKEEILGFKDYVNALAEFIKNAETPITIAIQGDWGTGKTSLMNLVHEKLKKDDRIESIWINTWQYSQFELEKDLTISIISAIIRKLNPPENLNLQTILKRLKLGKVIGTAVSPLLEISTTSGELASKFEKFMEFIFEKENDFAKEIEDLKSELIKVTQKKLEQDKKERIVIFIDDLDRIKPPRAVELLEVLKLFFDIEKTIFVLAIDYEVVLEGLKEKYGESIDEIKAKKFFEKIIQLPFNIPVSQYDIENYIKNLLKEIRMLTGSESTEDIIVYKEIIINSIGFNPRTVKRLFNYLLLLKSIAEKKGLLNANPIEPKEKLKVLFGITCMQLEYPELFSYFIEQVNYLSDKFFTDLIEKLKNKDDEFIKQILKSKDSDNDYIENMVDFLETFYKISKQEMREELTQNDINSLKELFTLSNITTARDKNNLKSELKKQIKKPKWVVKFNGREEKLFNNKELVIKFIDFLYDFYDSDVEKIKKEIRHLPKKRNKSVIGTYSDVGNIDKEYFKHRDFYILENVNDAYINSQFIPFIKKFSKEEPLINNKKIFKVKGVK